MLLETGHSIESLIDLRRYPLNRPNSSEYRDVVNAAREALDRTGAVQMPGFLREEACAQMAGDALVRCGACDPLPRARRTAYLTADPDERFPPNHPRNHFQQDNLKVIRGSRFSDNCLIHALAGLPDLARLFSEISGLRLFPMKSDAANRKKLAGSFEQFTVTVLSEGDHLFWHFDTMEIAVTVTLQAPDQGGVFEYVTNIRSAENQNYDGVYQVLKGDRSAVSTLLSPTGAINIFRGNNSIHRVSPVVGDRERVTITLAYTTDQDSEFDAGYQWKQ